ncbi:Homeobox-DDT domain protein RLT3 [Vitis vinifera]|uniref:Homeobox-DDT domain protein RLT3 n=1 Tax=Vitis vinifera TaxID=29760 RepID=A0A438GW70_VITVI|nr:Homeobox-DDT domain protein RLT3 [Vitis vinifera]
MRHKIRRKEKSSVGTAANCYKKAQAGGFEFFFSDCLHRERKEARQSRVRDLRRYTSEDFLIKGECFQCYTDPSFFKAESTSSGVVKLQVQREKKSRKGKKKRYRWRNGETPEKRQLNESLFDSKNWEKLHGEFFGNSFARYSQSFQGVIAEEEFISSWTGKVQRPFMDEVVEEAIDGAILKVPESNPEGETDKISSIYKVSDEREVQADGESKIEGNVNGYHSDDVTSDNYMDVPNTMDDSDANEENQELGAQFSDSQSNGDSTPSRDGSSLCKKGRSSIFNSDISNLAKNSPSNGDGVVEVFPCTNICVDEIVDVPPNHLSVNEESKPKSHEHVVPNDTCIDVTDVHGYRSEFVEASCTSSPKDLNVILPPVNCGKSLKEVSVVEPESDGISCDHIKPSTDFSNAVDNETVLGDKLSDASHLESKLDGADPNMMTSSECFAQAQSHPVDESYGGNPNFLSDVLQLMSNAPDLAPEKEKDQLLGSTLSRPLPDCSPASIACDADVKPVCIASEIDANAPENGFNLKNSTPVADMPHTLTLTEQWSSEITVGGPQLELDISEMHVSSSGEKMKLERVKAKTVVVGAASSANSEDEIPSNNQNCLVPKDLLISDDSMPETVQAEPVAVAAAAAAFGANGEDDFPSGYPNYPDPKDHLSLDDLVTESVPVTCSAHFATNGLHGCSLWKDLLAKFPPNALSSGFLPHVIKNCKFLGLLQSVEQNEFVLKFWKRSLDSLTRTEIQRQVLVATGFGSRKGTLRKKALDKELNPMVKYGLRPGTLKGELFSILLNQGNNGMKVLDLTRCVQISELNLAGTTEELELLIYSTLSSDITLYEKISSSSYRLRVSYHINEAENFQSDTDDSGSIDDDSKDNRKYSSNNDSDSDSGTPNLGKLNYMNHHKQRNGMLTIYTEIDETYPGEWWKQYQNGMITTVDHTSIVDHLHSRPTVCNRRWVVWAIVACGSATAFQFR